MNPQTRIDIPEVMDNYDIEEKDLIEYIFETYDYASLQAAAEENDYFLYDEDMDYAVSQAKEEGIEEGREQAEDEIDRNVVQLEIMAPLYRTILQDKLEQYLLLKGELQLINLIEAVL